MKEILFKAKCSSTGDSAHIGEWVEGYLSAENEIVRYDKENIYIVRVDLKSVRQFTGYEMFTSKVFIGDLVSNNYKTDREVIREIVEYEGCLMMKRIKGRSGLPKYISLYEHHRMNYKIIGNIHD